MWQSVEKEISLFQNKVTDIMLQLGDITKDKEEQFLSPPVLETDVILGEEFYMDEIRPVCVQRGYLFKKPPTKEDLESDEEEDDESSEDEKKKMVEKKAKVEEKGKQKGKKGGKNNQGKGN